MTEILLIRHGETFWNKEHRMQGQHDSPLTPLGLQQARSLAARLKGLTFTALYSSDLGRAHQTARCIADATGHEVVTDVSLRERCFGIFEGLTNREIEARYPEEYQHFAAREPHFVMERGESASQFRSRCVSGLEKIAQRHPQQTIAVVSHGLVLDALYRTACDMAIEVPRGFPLLNCSVNTFRYASGWTVVSIGDVTHLADENVTRFSDSSV